MFPVSANPTIINLAVGNVDWSKVAQDCSSFGLSCKWVKPNTKKFLEHRTPTTKWEEGHIISLLQPPWRCRIQILFLLPSLVRFIEIICSCLLFSKRFQWWHISHLLLSSLIECLHLRIDLIFKYKFAQAPKSLSSVSLKIRALQVVGLCHIYNTISSTLC
jgi:hypothetical protein